MYFCTHIDILRDRNTSTGRTLILTDQKVRHYLETLFIHRITNNAQPLLFILLREIHSITKHPKNEETK
jgi:hypothetical protein